MEVVVPGLEAEEFAKELTGEHYLHTERLYKLAVHKVFAALLSEPVASRTDFADRLADVFGEVMPDLEALGISPPDQKFINEALGEHSGAGMRWAMSNLTGGKWGLVQFVWIPRAVEFDLGPEISDVFRELVDAKTPLAGRVDRFREDLYEICRTLQRKGGFLPNWELHHVSLAFVALILAAYDKSRHTFYNAGALRYGYKRYAPGTEFPGGSAGEKYAAVCEFAKEIESALEAGGAPVEDLIDAQSFVWLRFNEAKEAEKKEKKPGSPGDSSPSASGGEAGDLAAQCYWPLERAEHLVTQARRWGQLLFQGPPGTGKTFVAEALARLLAGDQDGHVEVVQFHPSYAYEDFIEGIRPVVTEGSGLAYEVRPGIFMRLARRAIDNPEDQFFLVVDEINRANLPRVFGELLYALEYRGPEHIFRLPYSGAEEHIPENITIIATMNTADRSIALVDAAVRRRFRHVDFEPDTEILKSWLKDNDLGDMAEEAAARLTALNEQLIPLIGADRLIGHTYLMRPDLSDVGLAAVWDEDIEPVLREHLYSQRGEIDSLRAVFLENE